jgi:hypothetical protein
LRLEHSGRHARLEESRDAADGRQRRARLVENAARFSGGLPAMMAELTAPIEMPATQLGIYPAMARAS